MGKGDIENMNKKDKKIVTGFFIFAFGLFFLVIWILLAMINETHELIP
ncbi:hypothetical protein [Ammoniphilus sp. 3BR4]